MDIAARGESACPLHYTERVRGATACVWVCVCPCVCAAVCSELPAPAGRAIPIYPSAADAGGKSAVGDFTFEGQDYQSGDPCVEVMREGRRGRGGCRGKARGESGEVGP